MQQKIMIGEWYCSGGHLNSGGSSCPTCGATPGGGQPGGGNPIILLSWMALLFTAPIYPFAGGAALLGALAVGRGVALLDINALVLFVLAAAATMAGFYAGYLVEKRVSKFAAYRLLRDVIRFAVGALIVFNVSSGRGETPVEPAEIVGTIIVFPIILFFLKRLDRALKLDRPENDLDSPVYKEPAAAPDWLVNLGRKVNFPTALVLGGFAGVLAFAFGGGTAIASGLLAWVAVTLVVIVISGGVSILGAIDEKLGGLLLKIAIGIPLGAAVGGIAMHLPDGRPTPEGLAIGAVLGPLALIVWGLFTRWRRG